MINGIFECPVPACGVVHFVLTNDEREAEVCLPCHRKGWRVDDLGEVHHQEETSARI